MGYEKSKTGSNREKGSKARGGKPDGGLAFGDYRFVRIELTAEERDECRDFIQEKTARLEDIDAFLGQGFTVKFSTDKKGGGSLCAVTCSDPEHGDRGLILTARGSTASVAWLVLMYKDLVICADRGWRQTESERGGGFSDIG